MGPPLRTGPSRPASTHAPEVIDFRNKWRAPQSPPMNKNLASNLQPSPTFEGRQTGKQPEGYASKTPPATESSLDYLTSNPAAPRERFESAPCIPRNSLSKPGALSLCVLYQLPAHVFIPPKSRLRRNRRRHPAHISPPAPSGSGNQRCSGHLRRRLARSRVHLRTRSASFSQGNHPARRRARLRQGHQYILHPQGPRSHLRARRRKFASRLFGGPPPQRRRADGRRPPGHWHPFRPPYFTGIPRRRDP